MRAVLAVVTILIGIPLVVMGLLALVLGICWWGSDAGGLCMGVGMYAMMLGSPPCLMLAVALLWKQEK